MVRQRSGEGGVGCRVEGVGFELEFEFWVQGAGKTLGLTAA